VHAAAAAVAQQVGPRLGRFAVAVGQGGEFFAAVSAYPDHHEQAESVLFEADVDVDAVSPQIHEVHLGQVPLGEGPQVSGQ
jgi:hypothetical protein